MIMKEQEQIILSGKDIAKIIKDQESTINRYIILKEYYKANHDIYQRKSSDPTKPNNKLINNFPGYITDVNVGYFMGKPVTYSSIEGGETIKEEIQNIFDYNDEQAENAQLAKICSIKGKAYELLYIDEEAIPRFSFVEPNNLILVFDDKITPSPLYAIRHSVKDKQIEAELYTSSEIISYEGEGDELVEVGRMPHPFLDVPVVEFLNNDEAMGDFEKVISLVDAYDKSQSDSANDFEYFADAYLKIVNMSGTSEDDVKDMKKNRVILVDTDGDAEWLVKSVNDVAVENYKNRLRNDIHAFSMTPNLTDEAFAGNLSGVALEFKLWGLEQSASQKERNFKKALQRRIELLCNFLGFKGKEYDWRSITISFTRNIPTDLVGAVEMVTKLNGIISKETLLARLPFIDDPAEEIKRLEAEAQDSVDLMSEPMTSEIDEEVSEQSTKLE